MDSVLEAFKVLTVCPVTTIENMLATEFGVSISIAVAYEPQPFTEIYFSLGEPVKVFRMYDQMDGDLYTIDLYDYQLKDLKLEFIADRLLVRKTVWLGDKVAR